MKAHVDGAVQRVLDSTEITNAFRASMLGQLAVMDGIDHCNINPPPVVR